MSLYRLCIAMQQTSQTLNSNWKFKNNATPIESEIPRSKTCSEFTWFFGQCKACERHRRRRRRWGSPAHRTHAPARSRRLRRPWPEQRRRAWARWRPRRTRAREPGSGRTRGRRTRPRRSGCSRRLWWSCAPSKRRRPCRRLRAPWRPPRWRGRSRRSHRSRRRRLHRRDLGSGGGAKWRRRHRAPRGSWDLHRRRCRFGCFCCRLERVCRRERGRGRRREEEWRGRAKRRVVYELTLLMRSRSIGTPVEYGRNWS